MNAIGKRVTIDDLAKSLGLTKSTVSRALNDYADISEQTRLRVRNAATAMNYRPLSHAQAIKTGRVRSIGLVLQVSEHDGHRPFLADFLAGITEAAADHDWTLTLATATSASDAVRLLEKLSQERKADGFILPRTYIDDIRIDALRAAQVPFILYGRTANIADCAWYDIAGEVAMEQAVATLHKLGHSRIGFIPGGEGYNYTKLRRDGYINGLEQNKLALDDQLIADNAVNKQQGYAATRELLAQPNPPTAIICSVDHAALGAYGAIRSLGLRVGQDVSIISYDGIPEGAVLSPELSTYAVDNKQAGARLAELLIRRVRGEPPQQLREIGQARFLDRGSHGPLTLSSDQLAAKIELKSDHREE
ncbi:LacI family DNA-binding transcriptional regulator [Maritalea mediterranea]|uniref:Substrate-binding domain-containing protein n=1 Tax=Maritalea mediterranea TaxID=2909667 RepID=A0ABS9E675_9HYPH|nr:substrate-binding domain-containing protein [Maritalea mediterranea]MCF4098312.1 substrate-binding domain-containing protein [Maritalea mediterranea]